MTSVAETAALDEAHAPQGVCVQGMKTARLPWRFDVVKALAEAQALPTHWWRAHFNQSKHDGGWHALALRQAEAAPLDVVPVEVGPAGYVASPALALCPAIAEILGTMALSFKSVRLMALDPGSEILEHADAGVCASRGEARLHVPLQTDESVFFHVDGERVPLRAGECWYVDVSLPHRVRNRGAQRRIHLVADAQVDMRLYDAFCRADAGDPMDAASDPWQSFLAFRQRVFAIPQWAELLASSPDAPALVDRALRLGQDHGYFFEASDVESAFKAGRRAWVEQWIL